MIDSIVNYQTGIELFRLINGIYADIYRQVSAYNQAIEKNDTESARKCIITALSKAKLVRQRAVYYISKYGETRLNACIAMISDDVTVLSLDSEITSIMNYCQDLYDRYVADEITLQDIADNLVTQYENIIEYIAFPITSAMTDIEGNNY